MPDSDGFALQLSLADLASWQWTIIDRNGIAISRGYSASQQRARQRALVQALSLCPKRPIDEAV